MALQLVSEHPVDYFPCSVRQLGEYVAQRPHLIPFVGSLVLATEGKDHPFRRLRMCAQVLKTHPRVSREDALEVARALRRVDDEPDQEARSKVLEFLVWKIGPFSGFTPSRMEHQCSIREDTRRLVCPSKGFTVDAAFLDDRRFEGHECKINPLNFLHATGSELQHRSKLEHLRDLRLTLADKYGLEPIVCLTGLSFRVEQVREKLAEHGFGAIRATGPTDIERAVARRLWAPLLPGMVSPGNWDSRRR